MKKKLFRATGLIILAAVVAVLSLWPVAAYADLTTDSVFVGPVTIDGVKAPAGTTVTGWIDGSSAGPWSVSVYVPGDTRYALHIPANTAGGGARNGGVDGDTVHIMVTVGGVDIQGTAGTFQKSTNVWLPQVLTTPVVPPGPTVTTTSLPDGTVGIDYSAALAATSGTTPYTWSASGLPAGLSVSSSGMITGKPNPPQGDYGKFTLPGLTGVYSVVFTVTDSGGYSANQTIPVNIKWTKGDANGDGAVTVADVTKVELIILVLTPRTPGADANLDGNVTVADVTKIELIILGLG